MSADTPTSRATMPQSPQSRTPTVHALTQVTRHTIEFGESWGIPRADLLDAAEVSERDLEYGRERIGFACLVGLWDLLCARLPAAPLGLRRAAELDLSFFGAVGRAARRRATAREAIRTALQYQKLINPMLQAAVTETRDELQISIEHDPRALANPEWMEFIVGGVCRFFRVAAPATPPPCEVQLRHTRRHPERLYEEVFGVVPVFGAALYALHYPKQGFEVQLPTADPDIVPDLTRHLELMVPQATGTSEASIVVRVANAIRSGLPKGEATQVQVAAVLGMTPRTLQRTLRGERTSFRDLLETERRTLAATRIGRDGLCPARVAQLSGYSDVSQFTRAFKRWFGVTPAVYRRRHQ